MRRVLSNQCFTLAIGMEWYHIERDRQLPIFCFHKNKRHELILYKNLAYWIAYIYSLSEKDNKNGKLF